MREAKLTRFDGGEDTVKCYEVSEYDWINIPDRFKYCKHTKKPQAYFNVISTFDIETTTIEPEGVSPIGFMYHWQMNIGGVVVYGRRWEEWVELLERICDWLEVDRDACRLVIYVHNLGYEFQFMRNLLDRYFGGYTVFASAPRKPMKIVCGNGIEFRCSYFLTNMSLKKAVENEKGCLHPKADGDLNYKVLRTADTYLDDTEFGYCIADVVSLYELITNRLKNERDNLESIPLTSTGYVRRDCRNASRKEPRYREMFHKNYMHKRVYTLLKEAGRGGNTHANRYMSGRVWHNVDSYDVASSYPAQMLLKDFPMTTFCYYGTIDSMEELEYMLNNYACLFQIVFNHLRLRPEVTMPYIPYSKSIAKITNMRLDNGRVLEAEALAITVTDIDFNIIRRQYTWDSFAIAEFHFAHYGPLPESLRGQVMEYFRRKTELKYKIQSATSDAEREELEYLYVKSKNRLNGIFGMAYTDPVRDEIVIDEDGEWAVLSPNIEEALEKYMKSRNSFLVYAWGVWITAHARAHLQQLLDATGSETIYCDTDSSKAIMKDHNKINAINAEIMQLCEKKGAFCDVNGKRYYLGVYELETKEPYKEFKTLGAKKYVYIDEKGLHVTISGVNKKLGAKELDSIDNFTPGFIFTEAGGNTLYYNDDELHYINVDGCKMLTGSNIGMVDSTYEIGITNEYAELIGFNIYGGANEKK